MKSLEQLQQKIDQIHESSKDIYDCFVRYFNCVFEFLTEDEDKNLTSPEICLIEYVQQQVEFFSEDQNKNLHFLRMTVFMIERLLASILPKEPNSFIDYLRKITKGKIYEYFSYVIMKYKDNSLYKEETKNPAKFSDSCSRIICHWHLTQSQLFKAFTNCKSVATFMFSRNSVNGSDVKKGIAPYFDVFVDFLALLSAHAPNLKHLKLPGNYIGWLSDMQLSQLSLRLSKFLKLESLDLSSNYIDDRGLELLLLNLKEMIHLKELDFSNNFIELNPGVNYLKSRSFQNINVTYKRTNEITKYIEEMRLNGASINVSANYITEVDLSVDSDLALFASSHQINRLNLDTEPRKIESIINPKYFIDCSQWLVTIVRKEGDEHVRILIERMDENGQLYLVAYDVVEIKGEVKVNIKHYEPSRFIKEATYYKFWEFHLVNSSAVQEFEDRIRKANDLPQELEKCVYNSLEAE